MISSILKKSVLFLTLASLAFPPSVVFAQADGGAKSVSIAVASKSDSASRKKPAPNADETVWISEVSFSCPPILFEATVKKKTKKPNGSIIEAAPRKVPIQEGVFIKYLLSQDEMSQLLKAAQQGKMSKGCTDAIKGIINLQEEQRRGAPQVPVPTAEVQIIIANGEKYAVYQGAKYDVVRQNGDKTVVKVRPHDADHAAGARKEWAEAQLGAIEEQERSKQGAAPKDDKFELASLGMDYKSTLNSVASQFADAPVVVASLAEISLNRVYAITAPDRKSIYGYVAQQKNGEVDVFSYARYVNGRAATERRVTTAQKEILTLSKEQTNLESPTSAILTPVKEYMATKIFGVLAALGPTPGLWTMLLEEEVNDIQPSEGPSIAQVTAFDAIRKLVTQPGLPREVLEEAFISQRVVLNFNTKEALAALGSNLGAYLTDENDASVAYITMYEGKLWILPLSEDGGMIAIEAGKLSSQEKISVILTFLEGVPGTLTYDVDVQTISEEMSWMKLPPKEIAEQLISGILSINEFLGKAFVGAYKTFMLANNLSPILPSNDDVIEEDNSKSFLDKLKDFVVGVIDGVTNVFTQNQAKVATPPTTTENNEPTSEWRDDRTFEVVLGTEKMSIAFIRDISDDEKIEVFDLLISENNQWDLDLKNFTPLIASINGSPVASLGASAQIFPWLKVFLSPPKEVITSPGDGGSNEGGVSNFIEEIRIFITKNLLLLDKIDHLISTIDAELTKAGVATSVDPLAHAQKARRSAMKAFGITNDDYQAVGAIRDERNNLQNLLEGVKERMEEMERKIQNEETSPNEGAGYRDLKALLDELIKALEEKIAALNTLIEKIDKAHFEKLPEVKSPTKDGDGDRDAFEKIETGGGTRETGKTGGPGGNGGAGSYNIEKVKKYCADEELRTTTTSGETATTWQFASVFQRLSTTRSTTAFFGTRTTSN